MTRVVLLSAALVAAATVPGAAYMRFGVSINGINTVLRWPGAIAYRVSDAELADGISAGAFDQALQRASRAWESVGSATVRFTREGFTSARPSDDDASNVFGFERRADLAVHSLKDLPTELPEGLALAAVPERVTSWSRLLMTKALRSSMARIGSSSTGTRASLMMWPLESVIRLMSSGLIR